MANFRDLATLNMAVRAGDGLILRGTLTYPISNGGAKFPLAVLAHQYPSTRDSFAPLVADLLSLRVATLAFDERGHGESIQTPDGPLVIDTPAGFEMIDFYEAFVSSSDRVGFHHIADDIVRVARWGSVQNFIDEARILLVGASIGGSGALLAAPKIGSALKGVVTFGAAGTLAHGDDAPRAIRANCESLSVPLLLLSSENDAFEGAQNVRQWSMGLPRVRTSLPAGNGHGMAIYFDVRDTVIEFVRRTVG